MKTLRYLDKLDRLCLAYAAHESWHLHGLQLGGNVGAVVQDDKDCLPNVNLDKGFRY